jgi:DNA polymerase/3'-5' exonuclease PolX
VRFPPIGPYESLQLDIFIATPTTTDLFTTTPTNWGSLLLCRTGSREHNVWICERALSMGLKWNPYRGLLGPSKQDGPLDTIIASATEQDILSALGLEWIPPVMRELEPPRSGGSVGST